MKKTYMKPEVNEIEVAANQAVAACYVKRLGWQLSDKWDAKWYDTKEEAIAAQPDWASSTAGVVAPVYYYEASIDHGTWKEELHGSWADWNNNNVHDSGDVVYNQQGNVPSNLSTSWQGTLFNS